VRDNGWRWGAHHTCLCHTNSKLKCVALCVCVTVCACVCWDGRENARLPSRVEIFDAYERVRSGYVDVDGVACIKGDHGKGVQRMRRHNGVIERGERPRKVTHPVRHCLVLLRVLASGRAQSWTMN
jgi:hypothetical protein